MTSYNQLKYQRALELNPDLNKKKYQRKLELYPDLGKILYQRKLELYPDHNKIHRKRLLEMYIDFEKKSYQRKVEIRGKEKLAEYMRMWRKKNIDKSRLIGARCRLRKKIFNTFKDRDNK